MVAPAQPHPKSPTHKNNGERTVAPSVEGLQSTSCRILVVDDTAAIHEDFRKVLTPQNNPALDRAEAEIFGHGGQTGPAVRFELDSAFQGQEGLAKVEQALREQRPYAVAFVDVRMPPGWDGIETIEHLWRVDPDLQVVICTAYSDYSWNQIVGKLGHGDSLLILKKPFDNIEVLQVTSALARKWQLTRASKERFLLLDQAVAQRTEELRHSEEQFRSVWEHAIEGMRLTDDQGRILDVNQAYCELVQLPREKLVGQLLSVAYDAGGVPAEEVDYRKHLQAGDVVPRFTTSGRLWNGRELNLEVSSSSLKLGKNGPVLLSVFRDVTERRRAERRIAAFANLAQRLSSAKTAKAAAQIIVDVADQLFGWDACTCDLYNPAEDLLTHLLTIDIVDGCRRECEPSYTESPPTALARQAISEGGFLLHRSASASQKSDDGVPFGEKQRPSASILYVPIRNAKSIVGVVSIQSYRPDSYDQQNLGTFQALADHCGAALERIRAEERLRQTQEQLRQSQKLEAIGQLAGGVAHDFNNLLAVIRGNTDLVLIKCPDLDSEVSEFLHQIAEASDRAANLTRQLLAFSRKQIMRADSVQLNDVVGNMSKMLRRIIGENIQLECRCGQSLPPVHADVGLLEQALVNLVVNARDAMPRGGQLVISTATREVDGVYAREHPETRPGKFVTLTVTDTGTGIAPEHLPHIFEPFFTTKEVGKGTGLGLSTVYGILKQHEGWVEVASEPHQGASFTMVLPAFDSPTVEKTTSIEPAKPRGGNESILLVEDEDSVRNLTRRILERYGYTVVEAASGVKALELCSNGAPPFDLLLTDIIMPGEVTGRELADRLREQNKRLRVIFTSGYSGDVLSNEKDYLGRTKSRFLPKPCSPFDLLRAIRESLDRPH